MANLPVPNPRTAIAGEFETAAFMNAFRDAINFSVNPPVAQLYQTAAQSVPNGAFTALAFDSTQSDTYGGHSNSTNNTRYTAQVAGTYEFSGLYGSVSNATGTRDTTWAKNGAILTTPGATTTSTAVNGLNSVVTAATVQVPMSVGDYVELQVFQASGAALNTSPGQYGCLLSVKFIHA